MNSMLSIPNGARMSMSNGDARSNGRVRLSINGHVEQPTHTLDVPMVNGWTHGTSPPDKLVLDSNTDVPDKKFSLIRSQSDIMIGRLESLCEN